VYSDWLLGRQNGSGRYVHARELCDIKPPPGAMSVLDAAVVLPIHIDTYSLIDDSIQLKPRLRLTSQPVYSHNPGCRFMYRSGLLYLPPAMPR
jgi:hypothetical protein